MLKYLIIYSHRLQGDVYEYMLGKLAVAGQNGQFRTPKHIRDMMVRLTDPTPDDRICDPACVLPVFWYHMLNILEKSLKVL